MGLNDIHNILFNASILFTVILGIWSVITAVRNEPISGNFWGAVATYAVLAGLVLLIGIIMTLQGLRPQRIVIYYLYMIWLVIILPGLFTLLRGRDDRSAALAFALLCFFNAATSFSMYQRSIIGPWFLPDA
jgi:putative exporter of polyketide antibiotics